MTAWTKQLTLINCFIFLSMQIYNMEYYTAIIFFEDHKEITPKKYRNINRVENFIDFARKVGGHYVNLYEKKTKRFYCRVWLNN